ncbi:hypothetical protein K0B04_01270 [Patescibacteria group bacterium]|nr:hypothetical protein [Patescibacteria group bacterium]
MKIRISSLALPPLPKEIYIKAYPYKQMKHWANKGFYGTGSIVKAVEFIERKIEEEKSQEKNRERFKL